jgi:hypothetical protein
MVRFNACQSPLPSKETRIDTGFVEVSNCAISVFPLPSKSAAINPAISHKVTEYKVEHAWYGMVYGPSVILGQQLPIRPAAPDFTH